MQRAVHEDEPCITDKRMPLAFIVETTRHFSRIEQRLI
jgi:hypothetical protein